MKTKTKGREIMSHVKRIISVLCFTIALVWVCCAGALAADSTNDEKTGISPIVACTDKTATFGDSVQFESYADWTKQHEKMALNRVQGLDKQATPENIKQAKIYLARQVAIAKLRTMATAYDKGIGFVYEPSSNVWQFKTGGESKGLTIKSVQSFDDGLVVFKGEIKRKPEEAITGYIRTCEVTGKAAMIKNNLPRTADEARNNAFITAIRYVAAERYEGNIPAKLSGRLLHVDTLSSKPMGEEYTLRIGLTVVLDDQN
jgi:hypothetical protein